VYAWLVLLHLVGLVVFLLCHAVSMWVAFRIRGEPDRGGGEGVVAVSSRGNQVMYLGFILLGIGGLGAAAIAGWLTAAWVVASYVVLAVTLVAMWTMGSGFYYPLREGLAGTEKTPRLDDEQLRATLVRSRRPEALAGIGFTSLVVLVALMVLKPG
jgi:hypothetical protein